MCGGIFNKLIYGLVGLGPWIIWSVLMVQWLLVCDGFRVLIWLSCQCVEGFRVFLWLSCQCIEGFRVFLWLSDSQCFKGLCVLMAQFCVCA